MVALDIGIPFSHKLNFKTSGTIIKKVPPARSQEQSSLVRGHYFNKKIPLTVEGGWEDVSFI